MNNREKEIQQVYLNNEKQVLKDLKKIYQDAEKQIDDKIIQLLGRTDTENAASIAYQFEYQKALKAEIDSILDKLNSEQFTSVADYLNLCYEDGYIGSMYNFHGQGVPIITPVDPAQVEHALVKDTKLSESMYKRMGKNTKTMKAKISSSLSRGLATGSNYDDIAADISRQTKISQNKAVRIARTEGHRVQMSASMNAADTAQKKGARIVKQWDATLDARTRDSHARADGEIRENNEKFSNGLLYPGDPSGSAAEVINCRCALLQRAKWALGEDELNTLKDRASYYGLDKSKNFKEFKAKYLDVTKE